MERKGIKLNDRARDHNFSASFMLLKGSPLKDGRATIMLQLIQNRKVKRYSSGERCEAHQWDINAGRVMLKAPNSKGDLVPVKGARDTNAILSEIENAVRKHVDTLVVHGTLSIDSFHNLYRKPKATADVLSFIKDLEARFEADGRHSYAITFRNACSALRRFNEGRAIRFADLTAKKLEDLERYLKGEGCSPGGIGAYMRTIRVAVNTAIKEGLMAPDHYPFETERHKGYSMKRLKSQHNPRSLSEADMDKIKAFPVKEHPHLAQSVLLFLFSYFCRGMNFRDMAHLKRSQIQQGRIVYFRGKTGDEFTIPISDPIARILRAFAEHAGSYLLPILGPAHKTKKQQWHRIQKCLKQFNADLKEVARITGIEVPITSYVARHTFATTWKRKGVDLAIISEAMGHENVNTTRAYLKRFGSDVLDANDALL